MEGLKVTFSESFREKPTAFTRYLQTDWSAEDKQFQDGLAHFKHSIALANPVVATYEDESQEKNIEPQAIAPQGVAAIAVNAQKKSAEPVKDQRVRSVESGIVENPLRGDLTALHGNDSLEGLAVPERALKEQHLPTAKTGSPADELDDFFGVETKPAAKPPAKATPAAKPPEPDPFDTTPVSGIEVAADDAKKSAPPKAGSKSVEDIESKIHAMATFPPPEGDDDEASEPAAMEGFDLDSFKGIQTAVDDLLSSAKKVDVDAIVNELPNYAVQLDLDHYRKNPDVLSDKIIQVQAKRDSLNALMMKVGPELSTLIDAWDYVEDVGLAYSNASNREKRAAQAKILMKGLWARFVLVKRLHQSLKQADGNLEGQFNTLSRLITCSQDRNREVSRGAMPFEMRGEAMAEIVAEVKRQMSAMMAPNGSNGRTFELNVNEQVKPDPAAPKITEKEMGNDLFNEDMSQPLTSKKYSGMPEFPKNAQKLAQRDDKMKLGIIDF